MDQGLRSVESSDALDALTVEQAGGARCSGCPALQSSQLCELRSVRVAVPSQALCANHPGLGSGKARHPLGPLFEVRDGRLRVLEESEATAAAQRRLTHALADIEAGSLEDLDFRDRVVIWQARRSGDRQCFVHLDRLASNLLVEAQRSQGILAGLAIREGVANESGRVDPSRISLPGRCLVVSAFLVFGLTYWAQMELLLERLEALGRVRIPLYPVLPSLMTLAYLRVGIAMLRRFGVAFRADSPPTVH